MGTLSLTPRETSSGLRPPRLAAGPTGCDERCSTRLLALPPARGAHRQPSNSSDDPLPIPTREGLRLSARMLRERRAHKSGEADPADPFAVSLSATIRERTQLTLKQAHSQPDSANIFAAREQELHRQRRRLEELRRTYDLLHAEFVGKDGICKMLDLTLKIDKKAPREEPLAAPVASPTDVSDPAVSASSPLRPTPLEEITTRVDLALEELREMLYSCEVLAHMEQRTRMSNHSFEGELDKMRSMMNKLEKEEGEIRELVRPVHPSLQHSPLNSRLHSPPHSPHLSLSAPRDALALGPARHACRDFPCGWRSRRTRPMRCATRDAGCTTRAKRT